MARKNKDIEILVKLATSGNFDAAKEQLERLKTNQESASAGGVGALGKLQTAWKSWTTLSEVSAARIKNAFMTALGPIGALIVIVEVVIRTFGKLVSFVKDYNKEQKEVNDTIKVAENAFKAAKNNKDKYADATGVEALGKAIKAHDNDLKDIAKSYDDIVKKVEGAGQQWWNVFGLTSRTTDSYREQLALLAGARAETEKQLHIKELQREAEKDLAKAAEAKKDAEEKIADRIAKLTLDETAFKERELEKQLAAYVGVNADKTAIDELREQEKLRIERESDAERVKMEDDLRGRLEQASLSEVELNQKKLNEQLAAYEKHHVDAVLVSEWRDKEEKRIDDLKAKAKKKSDDKDKELLFAKYQMAVDIASGLAEFQKSKSKEIAAVGKAGAVAEALISAHLGAAKAAARVEMFPFNFVLAGIIEAAGIARAASIAGIALEDGGVVPGTMAGTSATIGEKGKAEAVLPLESPRAMKMVGEAISSAGGVGSGETNIYLTVNATLDWREIMNKLAEEARDGNAEIVALARRLGDLNVLHAGRAG